MNWLITGGCGFVGVNLVEKLLEFDLANKIKIIDDFSNGSEKRLLRIKSEKLHEKVELYNIDINQSLIAKVFCKDIDIVVHLAANTGIQNSIDSPIKNCAINILGTLNYLNASVFRGVKKFIFASSGATLDEKFVPFKEDSVVNPISPYGVTKATGEMYCKVYHEIFGLDTVSLRFSNIYGPHSDNKIDQLISRSIMSIINNRHVEIFGDGNQTRDFLYVEDLVNAIILASLKNNIGGGNIFQIASGIETSVNQIINLVIHKMSKFINSSVEYKNKRPGEVKRSFADISKAKEILNWEPKINIKEGIGKTVDWFVNHYK